jgi:hypothetical protein
MKVLLVSRRAFITSLLDTRLPIDIRITIGGYQ